MTINIDHYQDSGYVSAGRGSVNTLITNIGLKASGSSEDTSFAVYPIIRPTTAPLSYSYEYYTYFKLSGTYAKGSRVRIVLSGYPNNPAPTGFEGPEEGLRLYYRLTNTYSTPDGNYDGDLVFYDGTTLTLYPKISTIGPTTGLAYHQYLDANTTYFTQYVKLVVIAEQADSFGNMGEVKLECFVDEYEDTDL